MNPWIITILALLPPFILVCYHAGRGGSPGRIVAVQLAAGLTSLMLIAFTFAQSEPAFIDLALTVSVLSLPGTLLLALYFERWL